MNRYHVKIYRQENAEQKLKAFTNLLNKLSWRYSVHALDSLKYRMLDIRDILSYIKARQLCWQEIFEHYEDEKGNIIKACFRFKYTNNLDLIVVINQDKNLITLYLNSNSDGHYTLKSELYARA